MSKFDDYWESIASKDGSKNEDSWDGWDIESAFKAGLEAAAKIAENFDEGIIDGICIAGQIRTAMEES